SLHDALPISKGPNQNRWGHRSKVTSFWVIVFLIPLILIQMMGTREVGQEFKYYQLMEELDRGNISQVTFIEGIAVEGEFRTPVTGEQGPMTRFRTVLPVHDDAELVNRFIAAGVDVEGSLAARDWWTTIISFLPWLLIIAFWIFIIRQMQSGGAKAFQFGKSKAKLLSADTPKVTFENVAGADEAK